MHTAARYPPAPMQGRQPMPPIMPPQQARGGAGQWAPQGYGAPCPPIQQRGMPSGHTGQQYYQSPPMQGSPQRGYGSPPSPQPQMQQYQQQQQQYLAQRRDNPGAPRSLPPIQMQGKQQQQQQTGGYRGNGSPAGSPQMSRARQNVADPQPQPMFVPATAGPKMIRNGFARTRSVMPVHTLLGFDHIGGIRRVGSPDWNALSQSPMRLGPIGPPVPELQNRVPAWHPAAAEGRELSYTRSGVVFDWFDDDNFYTE